jgi:hypothetical protein
MNSGKKEAARPRTATTREHTESYHETAGTSSGLPKFPESVKRRYKVRRDSCGGEYIVLNGKGSLAKGDGLDHVYMLSGARVGAWLTSRQIAAKVQKLQKQVAGLRIEQFGHDEAVVSVPLNLLDDLCHAVNARSRRKVSDKERQRLQRISPIARKQKSLSKSALRAAKTPKTGRGA